MYLLSSSVCAAWAAVLMERSVVISCIQWPNTSTFNTHSKPINTLCIYTSYALSHMVGGCGYYPPRENWICVNSSAISRIHWWTFNTCKIQETTFEKNWQCLTSFIISPTILINEFKCDQLCITILPDSNESHCCCTPLSWVCHVKCNSFLLWATSCYTRRPIKPHTKQQSPWKF